MRGPIITTLFAAALAAGVSYAQPPEWSHAQSISVAMANFKFNPSTLTLQRGTPYLVHFTNTASGGHDFVAKEFFATATIAPQDQSKVKGGEVELSGGEAVDVRFIPNRPGTYKVHCSHFMHGMFGMTGTIIVQ